MEPVPQKMMKRSIRLSDELCNLVQPQSLVEEQEGRDAESVPFLLITTWRIILQIQSEHLNFLD